MADVDPNLVRLIAEQVLAAIRAASAGAGGGVGSAPVQVHAPIGTCTGDYSKFPELRGMVGAPGPRQQPPAYPAAAGGSGSTHGLDGASALPPAASGTVHPSRAPLYDAPATPCGIDGTSALPPANAPAHPDRHLHESYATGPSRTAPDGTSALPPAPGTVHPSHAPITARTGVSPASLDGTTALPPAVVPPAVTALKGVITVSQLRTIKGAIRLAKGAILTPLAADYIKDRSLTIMSDEGAPVTRVNAGPVKPANSQTFWWIDGQCSSVAKTIDALRPNILASREPNSPDNLRQVIKELAGLVKNRKVSGGLLFVGSAARATCYANRCASLRAIVGTSDKSVSEGIELLGANVLVIEYPLHGFKSMMAMVKPFVESLQVASAAVQKELDELRMCS